ncbi:MAG: Protein containing transglutaminase-like domain, putative cysteine protease [uncultured Friedmanniella sp.]|uniref:Protein containing transglutaminase-like domain, putative cysteine protease n=1 Tax=uncultured Friedmanniella sp. TaxID=335381 RepID=A0A6J4L0T3_9ACTN|nr:transglutaminase family protein [uncultured Friedmanniella sp.]CAA9316323.1 MAG: Protein containing transglutaminase-like domain, putative cysteine protease [uncultured Friedmanniella sp.]
MRSYRIQHSTTYSYDGEVTSSYGQFYLRPRELGWQRCLRHEISIEPEPRDLFVHDDLYGNAKSYFHVTEPHQKLVVTATSHVEVEVEQLDQERLALPWEQARPSARPDQPDAWQATDFTFPSPYVEVPPGIEDYTRRSFTPGRPVGEAAVELMHRVHDDFTYKFGSTSVTTSVSTLLAKKMGVCQDFSHFMVSGLRSLGLAGRYVSGYLATRPPPGKPRLVGADASHAWVGCWIPGAGWLYLDPTNAKVIDESPATVAYGRDYGDVLPVKGVIFTESKHSTMKVSVDMAPADPPS